MSSDKFDIEYLKWLQQVDVEEENSVWEDIQEGLDFEETWNNIYKELDIRIPQKKKFTPVVFLKVLVGAAAGLLILLAVINYFNKQAIAPPARSEQVPVGNGPAGNEKNAASEFKQEKQRKNIVHEEPSGHFAEAVTVIDTSEHLIRTDLELTERAIDENLTKRSAELVMSGTKLPQPEEMNLPISCATDLSPMAAHERINTNGSGRASGSFLRLADVGFVYSCKNTWLINYETRNGLDPKKLGSTLLTFHSDLGVTSTFAFKENHFVGLEFLWRSETGQNYQQYINASYVDRNIILNYYKLQVFYLWDHKKIPGNTMIGGYIAGLSTAEEFQGSHKFSVKDDYRNYDYGLLLGYRLDIPLIYNVVISPGIRINYNFVNIFEGDGSVPNFFKNTNNFAAGLNITVTYKFF